jgi:hypothetical protein
MSIMKRTGAGYVVAGLLVVGLALLLAACGGSSTSTTTLAPATSTEPPTTSGVSTTTSAASSSTTAVSGDEAIIAANFVKFFDGTQPVADKVGLLENGQQYTAQLEAQAASALGKAATASVSAVTITSPTRADVTYSILVGGVPALPNQPGKAVLQDGVWKVSADTFLALLALQQGATPASTP